MATEVSGVRRGDGHGVGALDTPPSADEPLVEVDRTGDVGDPSPAAPLRFGHEASLDGLRALAVLAIIAFHYNY